jgi:hypothetical protein
MGDLLGKGVDEALELPGQPGRRVRPREGADDEALAFREDGADDGCTSVGRLDPDRAAVAGFTHGPDEVARGEPGKHPARGRRRHRRCIREGSKADRVA